MTTFVSVRSCWTGLNEVSDRREATIKIFLVDRFSLWQITVIIVTLQVNM